MGIQILSTFPKRYEIYHCNQSSVAFKVNGRVSFWAPNFYLFFCLPKSAQIKRCYIRYLK